MSEEKVESLEKILRDSEKFFGDLTRKMLDHTDSHDYTSQQKKEAIAEFYRQNLSSLHRKEVGEKAEKIKEKANELNLPHETVAGFCVSEKLEEKATLFISRDETLLRTVRSEEETEGKLENSSMLRKFITSNNRDVYNLQDQLNQYNSSSHGFTALKQLEGKFDLGEDVDEVLEELEDLAVHRVNRVEDMMDLADDDPGQAVMDLKELVDEFPDDSRKISEKVVSVKKQQRQREHRIEEHQMN